MSKRNKKLLSLLLSTMMVFSVVPSTVYAAPDQGTEATVEQDANEEVKQEDTVNNEADASADQTDTKQDEIKADDTSQKNDETATQTGDEATPAVDNTVTVSGTSIQIPTIQFKGANAAVAEALTKDVEIDESNPAIKGLRKELENLEIAGGEAGEEDNVSAIATYADDTKVEKLTQDQIDTVVKMYGRYLEQWKDNAQYLGVQNPFFLDFNDSDNSDGLGVLGEMLAMDNKSVADVRAGKVSYDDLTGMILTFTYADSLGIKYYRNEIDQARTDVLNAVKALGEDATDAEKLLVINDWLAHHNTFDMAYIMNNGKDKNDQPMYVDDPEPAPHEQDVHDAIRDEYKSQLADQFHDQIYAAIEKNLLVEFYKKAIPQVLIKGGQSEEEATAFVEANKEAIENDPEAFVKDKFPDAADALKEQADAFIKDAEENGVEADPNAPGVKVTVEDMTQQQLQSTEKTVDVTKDGVPDLTFQEALEVIPEQAADGMKTGVINYWEGSQFGALGFGKSVCLGYSKAYTYLVQCLDTNVYLKNPDAGYESRNWKTADELYYKDGKLNIDAGYTVDLVRISFQSNVTMFGHTEKNFASDHYWNAVRIGEGKAAKWYYVDPCYTDVYTEVMSRDRVETDGDMSHAFFLFSDDSARDLYNGNFTTLRSLYKGIATDKTYEDAWMSRAASNVYYKDGYAYYLYDSTDLFDQKSNMTSSSDTEYKLVRHKLTGTDEANSDKKFDVLIDFTHKEGKETVVSVLKDGKLEKDETLTKLYAQFEEEQKIYPSIGLTAALSGDKIYFNVSNDILSYDLSSGEVEIVKEYNTVSATRNTRKLFGGMAFTVTKDGNYIVQNHPIAGLTIKEDGKMYVSIATNFGFISGKDSMTDHKNMGYSYEETNYNPYYTSNTQYSKYLNEKNDNDEFMWSANFVDTISMNTITGKDHTHEYEDHHEAAYCGRNAFTEKRCTKCDAIEAGTRKEEENTAHEHHYIKFYEAYYTNSDSNNENSSKNKGLNYVCPECGLSVTEPSEPQKPMSTDELQKTYNKRKAAFDAAAKNAAEGHVYTATDATLTEDASQITFQNLRCDACYKQKGKLDCLLGTYDEKNDDGTNKANYKFIEKTFSKPINVDAKLTSHTGTCDTGVNSVYTATGETEDGAKYTATVSKSSPAGTHQYTGKFNWEKKKDADGKDTDEYVVTVKDVKCVNCTDKPENITVTVTKDEEKSKTATCEEDGVNVWVATASIKNSDGSAEIGTLTDSKEDVIKATGHEYGEVEFNWSKDEKGAWTATEAKRTCKKDGYVQTATKVEMNVETSEATCTKGGKVTYTASATFEGEEKPVTESKDGTVEALGHEYKVTWDWAKDCSSAKATFKCIRGDKEETVDATKIEKTKEDGQFVYTATATYDGITVSNTTKPNLSIYYEVHRQDYGWEVDAKDEADLSKWKKDGMDSGTVGECKRLEAIKIKLPDGVSGSVQYRTHIQDIGWESKWAEDGALSGTSGQAKRLEAIQIKLSGKVADNYDIYYCVHAQNVGWLGWAKNGEQAGTAGYAYRLEAIRIKLVPKGEKPPKNVGSTDKAMEARLVGYQTHVQDIGTQDYVYDGAMAGTSGQAKRMESIRIKLPSTMASEGKIEYKSHIENIGWEKSWKKTGELSGTTGKSLRLEAIQIKLSGDIAEKYDVYYRVHAENFGWLGWAKNGEKSGTEGYAYRLEALQIKLVPKGTENPELPTPASAKKEAFIKK